MNYIDDLAQKVRSYVPDDSLPEGDVGLLFRLYALLVLVKGQTVTSADVHNAWAVWMTGEDPEHPALRPFTDLPSDKREEDQIFVDAIRSVAIRNL
jgi:hypothetical protein